jgi:hypothetical protein
MSSRTVDELADALLDAQEEYRKAMREHEAAAYTARQKFLDAVIGVEDELKDSSGSWLDLDIGKYEFEWSDGGALAVQLRTAIAERKAT